MTTAPTTLDVILSRRSIRTGFTAEPVSAQQLRQVVAAGLAAPSSKNAQPWRLHVVTDTTVLRRLAEMVASKENRETYVPHDPRNGAPFPQYQSTVGESVNVLQRVPVAIWVENLGAFSGGRPTLATARPKALAGALEGYGLELIGIGAAIENMWLAAHSLGLGAAFMGDVVIAEDLVRVELGLTGDLVGVLVAGHSSAQPTPPMDQRAFPDDERVVWHP
jgi:nitroreductase